MTTGSHRQGGVDIDSVRSDGASRRNSPSRPRGICPMTSESPESEYSGYATNKRFLPTVWNIVGLDADPCDPLHAIRGQGLRAERDEEDVSHCSHIRSPIAPVQVAREPAFQELMRIEALRRHPRLLPDGTRRTGNIGKRTPRQDEIGLRSA